MKRSDLILGLADECIVALKLPTGCRGTLAGAMGDAYDAGLDARMAAAAIPAPTGAANAATFRADLEAAINRCSMENGSNTPDFILARFLVGCLEAFDAGVRDREAWHGRPPNPGHVDR